VAQHPLIGYLVWAVLFDALFAWEGLALARAGCLPTLSDTFRVIMGNPFGRWGPVRAVAVGRAGTFSSAAGASCGSVPHHQARTLGENTLSTVAAPGSLTCAA
jgi:hypothetical protein